uniref:Uncharacterized protein n=1 Tax=Anguilla anguilla TaxID=7936 RepID=A0A0E9QDY7_ANGAN
MHAYYARNLHWRLLPFAIKKHSKTSIILYGSVLNV